jgi:hypothetical protein
MISTFDEKIYRPSQGWRGRFILESPKNQQLSVAIRCGASSRGSGRSRLSSASKVAGGHTTEKKYGQPMDFWFVQLEQVADKEHMEQVAFLKENFGMAHCSPTRAQQTAPW